MDEEPDFKIDFDFFTVPFWLYAMGCVVVGGLTGAIGAALVMSVVEWAVR